MKTRMQSAVAAVRALERAEGEVRAAAAADIGVPEELTAAAVMIAKARELVCGEFDIANRGPKFPDGQ